MDSTFCTVWASAEFFRPPVLREVLADLKFCRFGQKIEPDSSEAMKHIEELGGNLVWGELGKEDSQGIWLSRTIGKSKMRVMIPWKFIQAVLDGSAEQMKKFGFDDKEPVPEAKG